jgi:hypothetical protein
MMINNLGCDGDLCQLSGICGHFAAVHKEDCGQLVGGTRLTRYSVDNDNVANSDLLLPSAGFYNGVHHILLSVTNVPTVLILLMLLILLVSPGLARGAH